MSTKTYYKHKIEKILVVSKIVTLGYFRFDKNFKTAGETHDFWEMVYADRESIICTAGEKKITLSEGEVIFHRPNEFHAFSANGKKAPSVFVLSFECKSEAVDFFSEKKIKVPENLRSFLYDMMKEGKRTFDSPDPYAKKIELLAHPTLGGLQLIKNYLELFLINLIRHLTETEDGNMMFLQKSEWENPMVQTIIKMLSEKVESSVTIDEICNAVNYSRAYVCKEFRETTGKTIHQYYQELKIERATAFLKHGDMSIREISEHLGFDTPSYFCKMYKRITGKTPSESERKKKK